MSPLMRALETAAGVFGGGPFESSGRPLMLAQTELEDERAAHGAVACPDALPFIAFEGCRERLGMIPLSWLHFGPVGIGKEFFVPGCSYAQGLLVMSRLGVAVCFASHLSSLLINAAINGSKPPAWLILYWCQCQSVQERCLHRPYTNLCKRACMLTTMHPGFHPSAHTR